MEETNISDEDNSLQFDSEDSDTEIPYAECFFCAKNFPSKLILQRHLLICQEENETEVTKISSPECFFCKKKFSSVRYVKRHLLFCKKNPGRISLTLSEECSFCGKELSTSRHLKRHLLICKKNQISRKQGVSFSCSCGAVFNRKDNLSVHERKCSSMKKERKSCLFKDCTGKFYQKTSLIKHLESVHEVKTIPLQNFVFYSEMEFLAWKEKEEARTFSYFPKACGKQTGRSSYRNYYNCQHDGSDRPHRKKGEQARKTNRKVKGGPVKKNLQCIAKMIEVVEDDGQREIFYYPTHNHALSENDFQRQPVPLSINNFINNHISLNVPALEIYHSVKEIASKSNFHVSKKLIVQRIAKRRNIPRLHSDDIVSVCLKVELLQKQEYDPIVIFKPTGIDSVAVYFEETDKDVNGLDVDLFMLGIQTESQRKLMVDGSRKILIVDTHTITQYENMKLLNIMICDHRNKGWPVAHFITNSMTSATVGFFMKAIKNRIESYQEVLEINCVITNDDFSLINGIENAMQTEVQHILCQWHLDIAFKENIQMKCAKDKHDEVYTDLKTIISSKNIDDFEKSIVEFSLKHEMDSKSFVDYLTTFYLEKKEKWAMCYRTNLNHGNINTLALAESFHNRMKKIYLHKNRNKRMDDLLNILLMIEQDDESSRQTRETNMSFETEVQLMNKHHCDGLALPDDCIKEINDRLWSIMENPEDILKKVSKKTSFFIEKVNKVCDWDECYDKCSSSLCQSLCSHLYVCSCPNSHTVCKHIHKLHSKPIENPKFYTIPECNVSEHSVDDRVSSQDKSYEKLRSDLSKLIQMVNEKSIPEYLNSIVSTDISNLLQAVKTQKYLVFQIK